MENRPWLSKYPTGIAANINPEEYTSILNFYDAIFEKYGKKKAFTCMGKTLTYKQIDAYSKQFGAYLQSRGLQPGDRIAL
ncbi:MAG: AMP-binding protein, partial [Bacteroidota bacterium]